MTKTNYLLMEEESKRIALKHEEYLAIFTDKYEQDMRRIVSNIKHELDNADLPYLGLDLAPNINESLATIDLIKKEK